MGRRREARASLALPRSLVRPLTRGLVRLPQAGVVPLAVRRRWYELSARAVPPPPGAAASPESLRGVPGLRIERSGEPAGEQRQILYLHGGAYTAGSPLTHRGIAARLALLTGATVHVLGYRLAPEHPFPAALDDAIAAYRALAAQAAPERIALAGDSAGGGLALALAMRLREAGEPQPAALGLLAPWVDLTCSGESVRTRRDAGLRAGWIRSAAAAYAGARALDDPGVSPLFGDLAGLAPMHVQVGGEDLLRSDAERLAERARSDGAEVDLRIYEGLWHDFQLGAGLFGEADEALADLAAALAAAWGERAAAGGNGDRPARRLPRTPEVLIVGAGFGGVGMAMRLRRAGIESFTILERADNVGGVWRDNTYPGAACDVPSHLYSFSFEPYHGWSRRYAPQPEILAYLERCVERYGFRDRLRLGVEATRASFDERRGRWVVETDKDERLEADVLVTACGQLSRPATPEVPGLERFAGTVFHSARWDHGCDLRGKRVAVLGTGASAIQFVPAIAAETGRLYVFQRSAPYLIPKRDRAYREWEKRLFELVPAIQLANRLRIWLFFESLIPLFTRARRGMAVMRRIWFEPQFKEQVTDPRLREALWPRDEMGCKRILISSDWYPTLMRPDVELVTEGVREVTEDAIVTDDGARREVDVIILGTGFATTQFLSPLEIRGLEGRELNEAWADGAEAYLGSTVAGFPNMFMLYGPNTNLGAGSIIYQLESQIAYALDAIRTLAHEGPGTYLDVRPEVQAAYNREIQARLAGSVWNSGCRSWYVNERGRNTNNWPGTTIEFRRRTRRLDRERYRLARAS